jgi:hypothetical protein
MDRYTSCACVRPRAKEGQGSGTGTGTGTGTVERQYEVGRHSALVCTFKQVLSASTHNTIMISDNNKSAIPNSQFMAWLIITHTLHHAHAMTLPRVESRYHTRPRKIAKIKINYVSLSPWPIIIALRLQSAPVFFLLGGGTREKLISTPPPSPGLAQVVY